ncbi:MAG: hypothetical protein A2503_10475 [Burkholderiales bacterium RIFOXYD12_FULL_59_19]|nr:MAG: hypothetical protein A2503_10475 [Burkholderiales bacterium RIFOXYD12_FULL_59_19]
MSNAVLAQTIYQAAQALPDVQAAEVLDFIYFLRTRQDLAEHRDLQAAQQDSMNHVWVNNADEALNHV